MIVMSPVDVHTLLTGDGARLSYRRLQANQEAERGTTAHLHSMQSYGDWQLGPGAEPSQWIRSEHALVCE
ncbi:MAG: hypothetical protein ACR2JC_16825 [Chloroflexota bacterium]|nr:MAG: hypothetical protein DLM70_19045 [Chloroflexota bacterium]